MIEKTYYQSPLGWLEISGDEAGITGVAFAEKPPVESGPPPDCLIECIRQLDEYFRGTRRDFSLKLRPEGTEFQQLVWNQLCQIPYGRTVSYQDVAIAINHQQAVRAVGNTNRTNKIAIIIPCHRVIGKDGKLTGYGGGLWRKQWLLEHEKKDGKQDE